MWASSLVCEMALTMERRWAKVWVIEKERWKVDRTERRWAKLWVIEKERWKVDRTERRWAKVWVGRRVPRWV